MSIIYAIILGIVQGITEFLPISSSGHLLLLEYLFGIEEGNLFFNVLLHLASLLAVIIVMRKEILELIKKPFSRKTYTLILACLCSVLVVIFLSGNMDKFTAIGYLGFGFLFSSILLFLTFLMGKKKNIPINKNQISYVDSIIIGITQGLATLPGVSRSGSTICSSLLLGNSREESVNFSFLLSIPIIVGALFFELLKGDFNQISNISAVSCIVGFVSSFIVALFGLKLMKKVLKNKSWLWFSIYLFVLAVFVLMNQYVFMWF